MTEVYRLSSSLPDAAAIARAADVLRGGGLVAFPTETVYGLGANALDAAAVAGIFVAKGRPANNPLIVHIARIDEARELVAEWPDAAGRLAARFWPGPLTLVLAKRPIVPEIVTAGTATVGLRIPAHPVARALLEAAGVPIAAPSANRSNELSPTTAEHVLKSLGGRIDVMLDGGPTSGGLESTVLDLTSSPPRILRPGLITPAEIEQVIGSIERPSDAPVDSPQPLASPGRLPRHYAPRALMECCAGGGSERVAALARQGLRVGWLTIADSNRETSLADVRTLVTTFNMPAEPAGYAAQLYAALHALDDAHVDRIIVDLPPDEEPWLAIRDRLRRGAVQ
jgi:L-threonylcarbamoyladenylate synthase